MSNPTLYVPSVRDYFAGIALHAEITARGIGPGPNSVWRHGHMEETCKRAEEWADAMMAARERSALKAARGES